jgi:Spy/CpxP family protein refolding chaperone
MAVGIISLSQLRKDICEGGIMGTSLRALMGVLALVGAGLVVVAQEPAKKADEPAAKAVMKGRLPTHFKSLGLSDVQKVAVYTVMGQYSAKIDALAQQIKDLRAKEHAEILAVLTPAQKEMLKQLLAGDLGKDKPADSKPEDKKPAEGVQPKKLVDK